MNIDTITDALAQSWFVHIADISPWVSFTPLQQQRFSAWWNHLVFDENLRQYTHQERRILRYRSVDSDPSRLEINLDAHLRPAVTGDVKYQHGVNVSGCAEEGFINDMLLQQIIRFDQMVLNSLYDQPGPVTMDIHQFRVKACTGKNSLTTSGIHQDGYDWIFMHHINQYNARPVIFEIFNQQNEKGLLFRKEMDQFMETLIVNDNLCWHRASRLEQQNSQQTAWHDYLLVTCRCLIHQK